MKKAHPGQIIVLVILLGLLVFFLKDSGITDILIVIGAAVIKRWSGLFGQGTGLHKWVVDLV